MTAPRPSHSKRKRSLKKVVRKRGSVRRRPEPMTLEQFQRFTGQGSRSQARKRYPTKIVTYSGPVEDRETFKRREQAALERARKQSRMRGLEKMLRTLTERRIASNLMRKSIRASSIPPIDPETYPCLDFLKDIKLSRKDIKQIRAKKSKELRQERVYHLAAIKDICGGYELEELVYVYKGNDHIATFFPPRAREKAEIFLAGAKSQAGADHQHKNYLVRRDGTIRGLEDHPTLLQSPHGVKRR